MEERLTQDEVALVLRRAAELDPSGTSTSDDRLPLAALEAAASEVGLPAVAVRQAVAELRSGLLVPAAGASTDVASVIAASVVPLEPEAAVEVIGRWLSGQTFVRHRGRDGVEVWRLREDWLAGVQRKLDFSGAVRLKAIRQVVVRANAVEGGTLLRLEAELQRGVAAAPAYGAVGGAAVGSSTGLGAGLALTSGAPALVAIGGVLAGGGTAAGYLLGRTVRRDRRAVVADELAAALDRVATGEAGPSPLDRLRARARSFRP